MPSFKLFVGMTLVLGLAACGGGGGTDAGHDTGVTNHDSGSTGTDSGSTGHDSGSTGTDSGGMGNYGTCGAALHNCECTCGMANPDGGMAKQTCFDTMCQPLITMACDTCQGHAYATCCPTETTALQTCFTNATTAADGGTAPCATTDNTCLDTACMSQETALNNCLGINGLGGSSPNTACVAAFQPCFGDDATANGTIMCGM